MLSIKKNFNNHILQHFNLNISSFFFFLSFCAIFWAPPTAYGDFQARGLIRPVASWPTPEPQQRQMKATSATYTTAHGNTRSLAH